jgi:uncharacterized repeat protein (TIGR03803 family)
MNRKYRWIFDCNLRQPMKTNLEKLLVMACLATLGLHGHGQTFESLHSFSASWGPSSGGGAYPNELVEGNGGALFGITASGGTNGLGTTFKMTADGVLTTLVTFNGANGASPEGLMQERDGDFYGTTYRGGASNLGTVFRMTATGALTTRVDFDGANGANPNEAGLVETRDGNLYGISSQGGTSNLGTVFCITANGGFTKLVDFNVINGANPYASLLQASDGNLYGTTFSGGANGYGTVFRMTTNGTLTTLVSFEGSYYGTHSNGFYPFAGLVEAKDGNLYGTTYRGGLKGLGTVFKVTTNGLLSTLISFNGSNTNGNGASPVATLLCASDGNLYGTTAEGGTNGLGTLFRLTTNGVLTTLVSFNGGNGAYPRTGLVQAGDGNLYGTTFYGGTNGGGGTFFRLVMPVSLCAWRSGYEIVLSWPTNAIGYNLQAAASLIPPVDWFDSTKVPSTVGAVFMITNSLLSPLRFYRLKK